MRTLYWFRNDLRLDDNPGLMDLADADRLLLVYLWPSNRPWCNVTGMGAQRERFLRESVQALQDALRALGQDLLVLHGSPELIIPEIVQTYGIDCVGTCRTPGYHERRAVERLQQRLPVPVKLYEHGTLFTEPQLPFALARLPAHFTPFRHQLEALTPDNPLPCPTTLPRAPAAPFDAVQSAATRPHSALPIHGGSVAARRRLRQFIFEDQGIAHYKQTRNCLDPLDGSSTLSPWLASGCISPREVAAAIRQFEESRFANESTHWLYFELLWREYFHWRAMRDDISLFRAGFRRTTVHQCTFEPRSFARWCAGDTDEPLVNAVLRQLVATGWASNRGRQIAASYLVNELQLDWRYGAAFFEKYLVDYDVASNYGNWQYIAGVGADPRGGRHFDLDKQAKAFDPAGAFVAKWEGDRPRQPKYVTDAADWPISSP
jgi:deoxyribodipyrimidine photo-lyase